MGQEDERHTQIFTSQQHLVKYLDTLAMQRIDFLRESDEWTENLANWRIAVDGKLQTILNLLSHSLRIGPSQTVADDNLVSYFGRYLITTQLRLLLRNADACRL
jgi:hypothetical protein